MCFSALCHFSHFSFLFQTVRPGLACSGLSQLFPLSLLNFSLTTTTISTRNEATEAAVLLASSLARSLAYSLTKLTTRSGFCLPPPPPPQKKYRHLLLLLFLCPLIFVQLLLPLRSSTWTTLNSDEEEEEEDRSEKFLT